MTELTDESDLRAGLRALEREANLPPELIDRALTAARAGSGGTGELVIAGRALPTSATWIGPSEVARASGPVWRWVAPALAAVVVVAIAVTILVVARGGAHPTQRAASSVPLTVRIELDRTSVRAGTPITGRAIVTNNTARPMVIADCHGVWLQVGLSRGAISNVSGWLDCLTVPGTRVPVGTTTMPITIATTYNECTSHARAATTHTPTCIRDPHGVTGMPPLPPGTYSTETAILAPNGVPMPTPNRIEVTLTP